MLTVFVGWDSNEIEAYRVCVHSIHMHASQPVDVQPIRLDRLRDAGVIWRRTENRGGQLWDVVSNAPQATEFAISRFAAPILKQTGWCVFMDCDMVLTDDICKIMDHADDHYACLCVKHEHVPTEEVKMIDKEQTKYDRKNWSSVVLWNCDHPSNRALNLSALNNIPGRMLHHFYWLEDEEIGELPAGWNWLVNVEEKPDPLHIAHFTLGGPWFPHWEGAAHDELWIQARENEYRSTRNSHRPIR